MTGPVSSLRQFDRVGDRIKLHRQARKAPIAVVEGPSDERFARAVLSGDVDFFVAGSRSGVIDVVAVAALEHGVELIAGLVDRDFDDVVAEKIGAGVPLVAYDGTDLEAMLFQSPALERLLEEIASEVKLASLGGAAAVRDMVVELIAPVTKLRHQNARRRWFLRFDGVDLADRYKIQKPELRVDVYVEALIRASADVRVDRTEILTAVERAPDVFCPDSGQAYFRGRDAICVLGVLLRRLIGGCQKPQVEPEYLAGVLRLTVTASDLANSPWHERTRDLLGLSA